MVEKPRIYYHVGAWSVGQSFERTDGRTHRQRDAQTDRRSDRCRRTNGRTVGRKDGRTVRQTDRWTVGRTQDRVLRVAWRVRVWLICRFFVASLLICRWFFVTCCLFVRYLFVISLLFVRCLLFFQHSEPENCVTIGFHDWVSNLLFKFCKHCAGSLRAQQVSILTGCSRVQGIWTIGGLRCSCLETQTHHAHRQKQQQETMDYHGDLQRQIHVLLAYLSFDLPHIVWRKIPLTYHSGAIIIPLACQ